MKITFEDNQATIEFTSKYQQTKEDEEQLRQYCKTKFEAKTGHPIPDDEISVSPVAGEILHPTTTFIVQTDKPLYIGLKQIHQQDPDALKQLIKDLCDFIDAPRSLSLTQEQQDIVYNTIGQVHRLINPGFKPPVVMVDPDESPEG